jgi:hypothetical protein
MKRALLTVAAAALVGFASFGTIYACGDEAKAQPAVANAEAKEGCAKADVASKGCCAKKGAVVAKADGVAPAVQTADAKPCAGAGEGAGCPKKAKAVDVAKADSAKPVELAESAK